jgi:CheY-like chemotaxis protein
VTIPSRADHGEPDQPEPAPPQPTERSRGAGLILIVDDTSDTRELYSLYLMHKGFEVLTAPDGHTAIEIARQHQPDVIIMDLSMPRLDGIAATNRLKRDSRTRRIPVIILTAYPVKPMPQRALEAGAALFLTKPCLPEDLEQRVQRLLTRPTQRDAS